MLVALNFTSNRAGVLLSAVSLWLVSASLFAADPPGATLLFAGDAIGLAPDKALQPPAEDVDFPMVLDTSGGLDFDLGGSETRKLQLVLGTPLSLQGSLETRTGYGGSEMLGLNATLDLPLTNQFSIGAGINRRLGSSRFQPLGSSNQQQFNLGAHLDFETASASVNWFTRAAAVKQTGMSQLGAPGSTAVMNSMLLSPNLLNPLLPATTDPLQYLNSEASGVDLNFKVGIATDTRGDLQLGLAFSRVMDADFQGLYAPESAGFSWTLAEPFNSARMNLEWSSGAFSTGIEGYYRDSVDFLNRSSIDSITTFDVHFTWRTPWNANLSVGASNVLNAGADSSGGSENQPVDPLESIYGRIPYVRYKQDL